MNPLSRARAALLVVDIQERLVPAMPAEAYAAVIRNTNLLIQAATTLGLPVVVSQQYPKGLGATVADLQIPDGAHRFDKLEFSSAPGLPPLRRDQWILCGMETHVCVFQTARDLVLRGWDVHVCADAVSSRTAANRENGLALVARAGGIVTNTETVVFDLLGRAGTDEFKLLSKAIR
ncbi:MAG TPA: isochorismatase family protein [Kofleriaceae bacterium]